MTSPNIIRQTMRPRVLLPVLVAACLVYAFLLHPWMMDWGATAAERQMALPGDDRVPRPAWQFTRAITVNAPADTVWPWLVQLGQDRAGFYSYDWLENLTGANIHDGDALRADWQPRAVGDPVPMAPAEILGVRPGEATVLRVVAIDPGRALILSQRSAPANSWATVLLPVDAQTTRLIIRERNTKPPTLFARLFGEPAHLVMQRQMLRGIAARAEGQPHPPPALLIPARLGWVVAGIAALALFVTRRGLRRLWLIPPALVALPALLLARDGNAALAGFLAVGITILGALAFGRRWWAPYTTIAGAVMLTLLLAPDAYVAFGWSFLLIVVGSVAALLRSHHAAASFVGTRLTHRAA